MRSYDLEKEFLHKDNCGKGIIYNQLDGKFDVTVELNSSEITEHLLKVTYDELVDLKALSLLLPGVFYRITDYEFTSTDPEVINAGHRFDIIVLALSEDILSEDARAIQHEFTEEEKEIYSEEEQHYFDTSNLAAWKLKYSLDGDSKRFAWAPGNMESGIIVNTLSSGAQTLYRNTNKDEEIYYAFSNDNYTYYTKEEEPTEDSEVYVLNNGSMYNVEQYKIWYGWKELLVHNHSDYYLHYYFLEDGTCKTFLYDSYQLVGDYTTAGNEVTYYGGPLSSANYGYDNNFIVLNPSYTCTDLEGNTITGILVATNCVHDRWSDNSGTYYNMPIKPIDFYSWENSKTSYIYDNGNSGEYTLTLLKEPEVGDYIEVTVNGDSYIPTKYEKPWAIQKVDDIKNTIIGTTPKNITYRGTIYGMIDEYENDCEYDFKNALITGKYSLFDPDLFYYTFTNQGSGYVKLKDGDTPVLLNPGTYTFLGCMPFRLYEEPNYITYVQPIITDEGYDSWDFYAALTDEEEIDSETGETLYKVDMFVMPGYFSSQYNRTYQHLIKIFEDRKWYVKELIDPGNLYYGNQDRKNIKVYSKDSNGNIKEYSTVLYEYFNCTEIYGEYLEKGKAWIYDACFKDNEQFQDFINLNINSDFTFDVVEGLDNYASNINNYNDRYGVTFVVGNNGDYGVYYEYRGKPYTIKWIKQGFPTDLEGDNIEFAIYEGTNIKFTNTITITEPVYVYIKDSKLSDSWLDAHVAGDIVLSSDETLEVGQIVYDLYTTARDGEFYEYVANIVTPLDTSCAYSQYGPDCYRVTLRTSYFSDTDKLIPKVIMDRVLFSTIEARNVFLQDCYCVKARNGLGSGKNSCLFLKKVYGSNLQDVDYCTIEDCYIMTIEATGGCTIKGCSNTHIFNSSNSTITYVADSMLENIDGGNLCHIAVSKITKALNSIICGVVNSNILNLDAASIINNNSYGNVSNWDQNYKNIYINSLGYKDITLSDILDERYTLYGDKNHCVHIRSEEDLTITV